MAASETAAIAARLDELLDRASAAGAPVVPPATRASLLSYGALLLMWNERINLTGAHTLREIVDGHLPDAVALAARLGAGAPRIIDVGSGGGLPAIPLALLLPAAQISMFEPIAKKAAFLRTAIRELSLAPRARVEARRVDGPPADEPFDVAISRATLPPPEWLALAWQLVRPGGRVFALANHQLKDWPAKLTHVASQPYLDRQRWLIELERST